MKSLITLLLFLMSVGVFAENRLSDMIPYPFYESQVGDQNEVMQVTNGIEALQLRLEMIRRAEKT